MDKKYFQNKYRIDSIRLKEWDYSIPWWYFITTNSKDNIIYFGDIVNNKMILNDFGRILEKAG